MTGKTCQRVGTVSDENWCWTLQEFYDHVSSIMKVDEMLTSRIPQELLTCHQSSSESLKVIHLMFLTTLPFFWIVVIGPNRSSAEEMKRLIDCQGSVHQFVERSQYRLPDGVSRHAPAYWMLFSIECCYGPWVWGVLWPHIETVACWRTQCVAQRPESENVIRSDEQNRSVKYIPWLLESWWWR